MAEVVLAAMVVTAAACDLKKGSVYNWLTYPGIVAGLAFGAIQGHVEGSAWQGLTNHLAGFGFGFGFLFLAYVLGGMGGGDVKLMGAVGAFVGWPGALHTVFVSFLAGAVIGLVLVIGRGRVRTLLGHLGAAVRLLAMPGVKTDTAVPEATVGVPFGFAVCIGTLLYVANVEVERTFDVTLWDAVLGLF